MGYIMCPKSHRACVPTPNRPRKKRRGKEVVPPTEPMLKSQPVLLPKAISGYVAMQSGHVMLMYVTHITIRDHVSISSCLQLYRFPTILLKGGAELALALSNCGILEN